MTVSEPRRRGRPRTFDEDQVLGAVLDAFWTRGYAACSLEQLATAAGVSKPSLYAAFGDKRAMYLRALERFASELEARLEATLDPGRPLADGLSAFFRANLERFSLGDQGPRGCLVLCTAATEAVQEPEIRRALASVLANIDGALERRFVAAKAAGEIGDETDPGVLASLVAATLHSLAIRVRAGEDRDRLTSFTAAAVQTFTSR